MVVFSVLILLMFSSNAKKCNGIPGDLERANSKLTCTNFPLFLLCPKMSNQDLFQDMIWMLNHIRLNLLLV